tara:strand:- start:15779 stop:16570 length:792 start_codon:yes stop_codon:yes gene_type:complete
MKSDIFLPARLGSKRLPKKHLKKINNKPVIQHLCDRLKLCKKVNDIIICTTKLEEDDELEKFAKDENILVFRGSEHDILNRFLEAGKQFDTEIIIDVEADKIFTDPKYVDLVINELNSKDIDFVTGNDSLEKFNPESVVHGFIPAGFKFQTLEKICQLKKTTNTETGYKEFFTSNAFIKKKFLLFDLKTEILKNFRFTLDYPEDFEFAEIIFSKLDSNFDTLMLLKLIENNPELEKIIQPVVGRWMVDYKKNITDFRLNNFQD